MRKKERMVIVVFVLLLVGIVAYSSSCPELKIVSPENKTYPEGRVILSVKADEIADIYSRIDGSSEIFECGKCNSVTRYDLYFSKGFHKIEIRGVFEKRECRKSVVFSVI
jgi:hypothetical protein